MRERIRRWLLRRLQGVGPAPVIVLDLGDFLVLARPGGISIKRDSTGRIVHLRADAGLSELEMHVAVRSARDGG